jgi:hypothetical protein
MGAGLAAGPHCTERLSWSPSGEPFGHRSRTLRRRVAVSSSSEDDQSTVQRPFLGRSFASSLRLSASIMMRRCRRFRRLTPAGRYASPRANMCFRTGRDLSFFPFRRRRGRSRSGSSFRSRSEGLMASESRQAESAHSALWITGISGSDSGAAIEQPEQGHQQRRETQSGEQPDDRFAPRSQCECTCKRQHGKQDAGRTGRAPGCHGGAHARRGRIWSRCR